MKYYLVKHSKDNVYTTWRIPENPLGQVRVAKDTNKPDTTAYRIPTAKEFYSVVSTNKNLNILCEADTYENLLKQISLTYPELLI